MNYTKPKSILTQTTKMPGRSFSLENRVTCPTGSRLCQDPTSVCHSCYAAKGCYVWPVVRNAQRWRLEWTKTDEFVNEMIDLLRKEEKSKCNYFRWHDSGDIWSLDYGRKIFQICEATPGIHHRIPTREVPTVQRLIKERGLPSNLRVQISANYVDTMPAHVPDGCGASIVFESECSVPVDALVCPATTIRKECGGCRACWESEHKLIAYKKH